MTGTGNIESVINRNYKWPTNMFIAIAKVYPLDVKPSLMEFTLNREMQRILPLMECKAVSLHFNGFAYSYIAKTLGMQEDRAEMLTQVAIEKMQNDADCVATLKALIEDARVRKERGLVGQPHRKARKPAAVETLSDGQLALRKVFHISETAWDKLDDQEHVRGIKYVSVYALLNRCGITTIDDLLAQDRFSLVGKGFGDRRMEDVAKALRNAGYTEYEKFLPLGARTKKGGN